MELEAQIEYYKGLLAKCTCEKRGQDTAGCQTHGGDHQKLAWWRRFITYSSGKCSEFVDATDGIIARDPRLSRIIRLRKQPNVGGNNEDDDEDNFDETGGIVNSAADSPHLFPQEQRQLDQRRLQQRLVSTHQTISSTTLFSSTSSRTTSTADVFNTASQLDGSATMTSSASASFKRFTSSTSAFIMKPRPIPWKQVSQRSIDSVITSTGSDAAAATTTSSNLNNNDKSAPVGLFKRQTSKKIVPSMA